jgi:hypothetical protein
MKIEVSFRICASPTGSTGAEFTGGSISRRGCHSTPLNIAAPLSHASGTATTGKEPQADMVKIANQRAMPTMKLFLESERQKKEVDANRERAPRTACCTQSSSNFDLESNSEYSLDVFFDSVLR